jgi:S-(hydroxymethyl)glutathione dehydrogenase/alcohol dehydrogenase
VGGAEPARLSGAAVIAGVDTVEAKHGAARRFGATHAVHPDQLAELSAEVTGGEGFDYVFEVVGTPQTIRAAWTATRRGGTLVIVGAGRADDQVEFSPFELLFDGKKMLASLYGSADVRRDYARMFSLWRAGRLDLEGMITQRLKLDDIDQALAALGRGDVVRQVIIHG